MGPLSWLSDDLKLALTLIFELALALALLRFALHGRRRRLLASLLFLVLLVVEGVAYDLLVARPRVTWSEYGFSGYIAHGVDARTRNLGWPLLRVVAFTPDSGPFDPFNSGFLPTLDESRATVTLHNFKIGGVGKVFLFPELGSPRELRCSNFDELRSTLADTKKHSDELAFAKAILDAMAPHEEDAELRDLLSNKQREAAQPAAPR